MKNINKKIIVKGNHLEFHNVTLNDAAFILELRTDENKSKHLSRTSNDLDVQQLWLKKYDSDNSQIYFIIYSKKEKVGTVRIYDLKEDSFCWGSWIIKSGSPNSFSIESMIMVYQYGLSLGFNSSHFDVRKDNKSVWSFHEKFGAKRISENLIDYFYEIDKVSIEKSLTKYKKYLPHNIKIINK